MSVLEDGTIREIPIGELNRSTSKVVRSVSCGERLIVTRHGEPQAVMLSVKDAIELLVEARLPPLVAAAERDLREGRVEPLEPPGPCPAVLSQEAVAEHERMNARDRFELRVAVVGGKADDERPVRLRSGRWLISVVYSDVETVLVCAAFEVRELERELIGEEIWLARARRDLERMRHARDLDRLPA